MLADLWQRFTAVEWSPPLLCAIACCMRPANFGSGAAGQHQEGGGAMAARLWYDHAWLYFLLRVAVLWFAIATYLLGAMMLMWGTLLSLFLLAYQWVRYGVWCACSLADLFARKNSDESSSQSAASWYVDTALLITMPSVGGALAVVGLALYFSVELLTEPKARRAAM